MPMWYSMEAASGWTWTTVTSLRCSLTYSLKAIRRGSFASMRPDSSGGALLLGVESAVPEPVGGNEDERSGHGGSLVSVLRLAAPGSMVPLVTGPGSTTSAPSKSMAAPAARSPSGERARGQGPKPGAVRPQRLPSPRGGDSAGPPAAWHRNRPGQAATASPTPGGLFVREVRAGSPAARAGLAHGDLIMSAGAGRYPRSTTWPARSGPLPPTLCS
jgi:hypothetical protein